MSKTSDREMERHRKNPGWKMSSQAGLQEAKSQRQDIRRGFKAPHLLLLQSKEGGAKARIPTQAGPALSLLQLLTPVTAYLVPQRMLNI